MEHDPTLADLPDGVLSQVLAHVGACNAKQVFKMRTLCKTFRRAVDSPEVYRQLDDDSLYSLFSTNLHKNDVLSKMRENRNPNMLFRDGMNKFFSFGDEAAGKEMMQQASNLGQRDATFVLGMLVMGESQERQAEAKQLLTSTRTRLAGLWDVARTANKVRRLLADPRILWRAKREYTNCILCCPKHKVLHGQTLRDAFFHRRAWLFDCNVCLWDACYINFVSTFGIFYF